MRKIPTLFVRDWDGDRRYVLDKVSPGCEWVTEGEGVPTRKYDGTCVMQATVSGWWARREVKPGKTPPPGFVAIEHDDETGKTIGWEPVAQSGFARWHTEALNEADWPPGTYELCGPKVNGNPEGYPRHVLIAHDTATVVADAPRDFAGLATWLHAQPYEGVVWHHPDGRMCKIKRRDFRRPE